MIPESVELLRFVELALFAILLEQFVFSVVALVERAFVDMVSVVVCLAGGIVFGVVVESLVESQR